MMGEATTSLLGLRTLDRKRVRTLLLFSADLVVTLTTFFAAILLRFGFTFPVPMRRLFWTWWMVLFLVQICALVFFRLYNVNLRFVGILQLFRLLKAFFFSTALVVALNLFVVRPRFVEYSVPVGVLIIDGLLAFMLFGGIRLTRRIYLELRHQGNNQGKPTLIVGANIKSERLIKEMRLSRSKLEPVVIADLGNHQSGETIYDLPVVDYGEEITRTIRLKRIEAALINLPTAGHRQVKEVFDRLKQAGVNDIRIVPRMDEWQTSVNQIRQINIEDLLARDAVSIDTDEISRSLTGKVVMVTGAAGSIGSEIVRKLHVLGARRVVALDIDETGIFRLQQELTPYLRDQEFSFVVGSVRDTGKMEAIFRRYRPQYIFHAAAYKHVPLMENFPEEAVRTNFYGTHDLARLAIRHGVEKFVNVSTDKAVKPSSVMGATKRLAEMTCQALNENGTRFLSVRFGNVLGSRGSVIPVFQEQIRRGGPVTITHPDMRRYFMSIPEAVLLVLQASYLGKGGEVFVLDMGEPVPIVELAENLIRLNGFEPGVDIDIVCTGIRPGEKLYEELLTAEEGVDTTEHKKIFIARFDQRPPTDFLNRVRAELGLAGTDVDEIRAVFRRHLPTFSG